MPPCSTLRALSHLQHLLAAPNAGSRPGKEQLVAVALASSSHQSWRLSWQEREARGYPPAAITPGSLLTLPRGSQAILWQLPTGHCCSPSDTQAAVTASLSFVCTGNSPRFRLPSPDAELSSPPSLQTQRDATHQLQQFPTRGPAPFCFHPLQTARILPHIQPKFIVLKGHAGPYSQPTVALGRAR